MPVAAYNPYYTINLSKVLENYKLFQNAIRRYGRSDIIAYSIKANYDTKILETLGALGAYMEVCSEYEYLLAKPYVGNSDRIIINGFRTSPEYFNMTLNRRSLNIIGTTYELEWIKKGNCPSRIGIRLNLDYIKQGKEFYQVHSRFGISPYESTLHEILADSPIRIVCLHCHFAGNTRNPLIYYQITRELCRIINILHLPDVEMLDIGGGYKIGTSFWHFEDYVQQVVKALKEERREDLKIIFEPGNCIVRNTCAYHMYVIGIIQREKSRDIITNGTKFHCCTVHNKTFEDIHLVNDGARRASYPEMQRVVGCSCKESDIICELSNFPEIKLGDELVIDNLGAYTINEVPMFLLERPDFHYTW